MQNDLFVCQITFCERDFLTNPQVAVLAEEGFRCLEFEKEIYRT